MLKMHSESHVDHALSKQQVDYLLDLFKDRDGRFLETVTLPEELGTVPCGLFGPAMGDDPVAETEVVYERRGSRAYDSRLVDRQPRPTRQVTIIAGPHDGLPCVWYTAFGGPVTPKEPGDPYLRPEERAESEGFWKTHALAR